jgi:hypothetical protein
MIGDLTKEIDKIHLVALREAVQPLSAGVDPAYELGRRVGKAQGIATARQAIIEFHTKDTAKDKDL